MATLTRSMTIEAPVAAVFAAALDISKLWAVDDVALRDVEVKPDGVGTSAVVYSHVLGFHLQGKVEYTEVVPDEKIVAQVHFFAESPVWTLTFEPEGDGTKVTVTGEWHIKIPAVGKPLEGMIAKEHNPMADQMLANIKDQALAPANA